MKKAGIAKIVWGLWMGSILKPKNCGSYCFNCRGSYIMVLFAVVNTDFGELLEEKKIIIRFPSSFANTKYICILFVL